MLVDTGAEVTVVSSRVYSQLPEHEKKKLRASKWRLRTASGSTLPVKGQMSLRLRTAQLAWPMTVLIAEIEEDGILGSDFLGEATIDYKRRILIIDGKDTPLLRDNTISFEEKNCYRVYLDETVELPGRSEVWASCTIGSDSPQAGLWMIRPGDAAAPVKTEHALVEQAENGSLSLRMFNSSDIPVKMRKGTRVAECEPVEADAIRSVCVVQDQDKRSLKQLPEHLKAMFAESSEFLLPDQSQALRQLLLQYQQVFSSGPKDVGRTDLVKHKIETGDARPIKIPPRRIPLAKQAEAAKCLQEMKDQGVIQASNSPWSAPLVLVKKKDNSTRVCVDYRALNDITKKDSFPLPRIDMVLDSLAGSSWFSTLDLKSGYWQVAMDPKDREKTAFSAGDSLWEFTVMPFGLCNSPATFSRLMEQVLQGVSSKSCLKYLDDVIVHGRSFEDELEHLKEVLEKLKAAGLKLNPKKCHLFQRQVHYLGHVVNAQGVTTDPEKVDAVLKWPRPGTKTEVRSFLGLCSYYRRFVPSFASIAKPLHVLTEERSPFVWTFSCQEAFDALKSALTKAPILVLPTAGDEFVLDTDASNFGIGAVLSRVKNGSEQVIAYFSQTLSKPEKNYCVTRKELLALVKSIGHFHHYLYGRSFTVRTDHSALQWLMAFKTPEGQLARWLQKLQDYSFKILHRPGRKHGNADALSRRPCPEDCKHCTRAEVKEGSTAALPIKRTTLSPEVQSNRTSEDLKQAQRNDPVLGRIIEWLESGHQRPDWKTVCPQSHEVKSYWVLWDSLCMQNGILMYRWETPEPGRNILIRVLPRCMRQDAWKQVHEDPSGGHLGATKTLNKLRERCFWTGQRWDVKKWCDACTTCAAKKGPPRKPRSPLQQYNVGYPGERVAIDVLGPLPETRDGNRYLLCLMDYFTKWPEAYAIPNQEAPTVADAIVQGYVSRFGVPHELHSDQGRNFESLVFKGVCDRLGIKKTRTTPLHPQSDGMVERYNRTIGNQLAMYANENPEEWDRHVPLLLLAYRSAVHEATRETPAKLMLGRELTLPVDLFYGIPEDRPHFDSVPEYIEELDGTIEKVHAFARDNIKSFSNKAKDRYDLRANDRLFKAGDAVWLYNPQRKKGVCPKLTCPWKGPYVVLQRINDVLYRIRQGPRTKPSVVHKDRLKPYLGDIDPTWLPEATAASEPATEPAAEDSDTEDQPAPGGSPAEEPPEMSRDVPRQPSQLSGPSGVPEIRRGGRQRRRPARYVEI